MRLFVGPRTSKDLRRPCGPRRSIPAEQAAIALRLHTSPAHNPYLDTKLPRLMFHPVSFPSSAPVLCFSAGDTEHDVVIGADECAPGQTGRLGDSSGRIYSTDRRKRYEELASLS